VRAAGRFKAFYAGAAANFPASARRLRPARDESSRRWLWITSHIKPVLRIRLDRFVLHFVLHDAKFRGFFGDFQRLGILKIAREDAKNPVFKPFCLNAGFPVWCGQQGSNLHTEVPEPKSGASANSAMPAKIPTDLL
jgi:hypothetical protein